MIRAREERQEMTPDDAATERWRPRRRQALRNAIWKLDYTRTRRDRILMTWSRAVRLLRARRGTRCRRTLSNAYLSHLLSSQFLHVRDNCEVSHIHSRLWQISVWKSDKFSAREWRKHIKNFTMRIVTYICTRRYRLSCNLAHGCKYFRLGFYLYRFWAVSLNVWKSTMKREHI